MSEPAKGPSPLDEICQPLAALIQAVKNLQEGYVHLEERVQSLATPATIPAFASTSAASATQAGTPENPQ